MPRNQRCVLPGLAYHVTQRGVDRANVFYSKHDRQTYLYLIQRNLKDAGVRVLAYSLMTNHVHWVVKADHEDSLAVLFRRVHGCYAQYFNARRGRTGHLWQNRYFSCALSVKHEGLAVQYAEWNPVRAGLVVEPEEYRWSSYQAHLAGPGTEEIPVLDWDYWRIMGCGDGWKQRIVEPVDRRQTFMLRRATYAGAPVGDAEFVASMEQEFSRKWWAVREPHKPMARQELVERRSIMVAAS